MSSIKCKECRYFDPIKSVRSKVAEYGWCAIKSTYPTYEEIGQVFPPGVKRAEDPTQPAKPVIVKGEGVVANCTQVKAK